MPQFHVKLRDVNVRMHDEEVAVDEGLVRRLINSQLAEWANLELTVVDPWGTDNAIWRLGENFVVRLPRIAWAALQPAFEAEWLSIIAPSLSIAVPEPLALGRPEFEYPFQWSVHRWIPGVPASFENIADPLQFAVDIATVIRQMQGLSLASAPPAKNRARPLREYDSATRNAIAAASHLINADAALSVWEEALNSPAYDGAPLWVHGDLEGNCLVHGGVLSGLIDWGSACVGDPAVDIQVVWSPLFSPASRQKFFDELKVDSATIARSRGAAVHQACSALHYYLGTYPDIVKRSWHKLDTLGIARTS